MKRAPFTGIAVDYLPTPDNDPVATEDACDFVAPTEEQLKAARDGIEALKWKHVTESAKGSAPERES